MERSGKKHGTFKFRLYSFYTYPLGRPSAAIAAMKLMIGTDRPIGVGASPTRRGVEKKAGRDLRSYAALQGCTCPVCPTATDGNEMAGDRPIGPGFHLVVVMRPGRRVQIQIQYFGL